MHFHKIFIYFIVILTAFDAATSTVCQRDNVVRALQSCAEVASTFCVKLLATSTPHVSLTAPTCVTQFPSSRLPSACSCLTSFPAISTSSLVSSTSSKAISTISTTSPSSVTTKHITSSSAIPSHSSSSSKTTSISISSSIKTSSRSQSPSYSSTFKSSSTVKSSSTFKSSSATKSSSTKLSSTTVTSVFSSFTGVSTSVINAPSSCYQLPTPTGNLTAVPYNNANSPLDSPITMYVSSNGTSAGYVGVVVNGSNYLFDFSNPASIAITNENGTSMVINNTGVYFFAANCHTAVAVNIPNFAGQIALANQSSSVTKRFVRDLGERTTAAETDFTVDLTLTDQCGNPWNGQSPTLQSGLTPCTFQSSNNGEYIFTCQYPGALSAEAICENDLGNVLNKIVVTGLFAASPWWAPAIAKILPRNIVGLVAGALGIELGLAGLIAATIVVTVLQKYLLTLGADAVTAQICLTLFGSQAMNVIMSLNGQQLIETITSATSTTQALTVVNPNTPSCCAGGSCGTYASCGAGGGCLCGSDVNGVAACVLNAYCDTLTPCAANTDCSSGWVCLVASCCGYSVCADATSCGVGSQALLALDAPAYNSSALAKTNGLMLASHIIGA